MSTQARDLANGAVAPLGLIRDAAPEQGLELAASPGRPRTLVARMAGRIDAVEEERWHRGLAGSPPVRGEEAAPSVGPDRPASRGGEGGAP